MDIISQNQTLALWEGEEEILGCKDAPQHQVEARCAPTPRQGSPQYNEYHPLAVNHGHSPPMAPMAPHHSAMAYVLQQQLIINGTVHQAQAPAPWYDDGPTPLAIRRSAFSPEIR